MKTHIFNNTHSAHFLTEVTHDSTGADDIYFDEACAFYFWKDFLLIQNPGNGTLSDSFWDNFLPKCEQLSSLHWTLAHALNIMLRIVLIVGTVLNVIIMVVLSIDDCRTSTDVYLLSISLGDLTICVSSIISTQLPVGLGGIYLICLGQILGNIGLFACVTTVMVFTMERYKVIRDPLASLHACGREKSMKIVTSIWITLALYSTGVVFFILDYDNIEAPQPYQVDRTTIIFYINVVFFYFIPMIVSLTLYTLILKRVAQRKRNFVKTVEKRENKNEGCTLNEEGLLRGEEMMSVAPMRDGGRETNNNAPLRCEDPPCSGLTNIIEFKKMLKLFILLLVSFLILMSPYRLFSLVMSILSYSFDFAPEGWTLFYIQATQWITTIVFASNSIVDPILFNFLSTRFRTKLKKIGETVAKKLKVVIPSRCMERQPKDDGHSIQRKNDVVGPNLSVFSKTEITITTHQPRLEIQVQNIPEYSLI